MENNPFEDLILESAPIIGVLNKVINADLSIVNRVEYYSLNLEGLNGLSKSEADAFKEALFTLVQAKAFRLTSMIDEFEEHDEEGELIESNVILNNLCGSLFDEFPERNLIKGIGVMDDDGDNIPYRGNESNTFEF